MGWKRHLLVRKLGQVGCETRRLTGQMDRALAQ
jgi:hypothetical protein